VLISIIGVSTLAIYAVGVYLLTSDSARYSYYTVTLYITMIIIVAFTIFRLVNQKSKKGKKRTDEKKNNKKQTVSEYTGQQGRITTNVRTCMYVV
jgi:large-conductance mechanosensitive channel